ncbi:hypothetical protein Hanom_Chr13g01234151 [Helianthus anomalus]
MILGLGGGGVVCHFTLLQLLLLLVVVVDIFLVSELSLQRLYLGVFVTLEEGKNMD